MLKSLLKRIPASLLPILALVFVGGYWLGQWRAAPPSADSSVASYTTNNVRAQVTEIVQAGQVDLGGKLQNFQILAVEVLEGRYAGRSFEIDYGRRQIVAAGSYFSPGDQLLITVSEFPEMQAQAYYTDYVRSRPLAVLFLLFVITTLFISGRKGARSLISMAFSLTVIIAFILPRILAGEDPVWVSVLGAFGILAGSLYLVYGWTIKTHAAVIGTLIALLLTGLMADYFIQLTRMTGFSSEEAMFLSQQSQLVVDFRGLVLGGIIIGSLGVLDDLVITQASVIFELYLLDPKQTWRALYRRGMRVGQDHVAATVNTLVLAYTGAALPLLLLVTGAGTDWFVFINREFVAEEILRTLVGSLGLMMAVPLTTLVACWAATSMSGWGRIRPLLGPALQADFDHEPHGHGHHHH
ncbi:MAG: YibE/F family protein [Anaerolineales bacterium]|nr:MAG: YibE/F family protein [Anaerolineales bacterium]